MPAGSKPINDQIWVRGRRGAFGTSYARQIKVDTPHDPIWDPWCFRKYTDGHSNIFQIRRDRHTHTTTVWVLLKLSTCGTMDPQCLDDILTVVIGRLAVYCECAPGAYSPITGFTAAVMYYLSCDTCDTDPEWMVGCWSIMLRQEAGKYRHRCCSWMLANVFRRSSQALTNVVRRVSRKFTFFTNVVHRWMRVRCVHDL